MFKLAPPHTYLGKAPRAGKAIKDRQPLSRQREMAMMCPNCGTEDTKDKNFRGDRVASSPEPPPRTDESMQPPSIQQSGKQPLSKKGGRKKLIAVSIVVAAVVIIATVAVSWAFIFSGSTGIGDPPNFKLIQTNLTNGVEFAISNLTKIDPWSTWTIELNDSMHHGSWQPSSESLSGGAEIRVDLGSVHLDSIRQVDCQIIDLMGNGAMDVGDSLVLTGTPGTYTVQFVFESNGYHMVSAVFVMPGS